MTNTHWTTYERLARRYSRTLPVLHRVLSQRFPEALWLGDPGRAEVALTFDDGPHPNDTPALLNVLARHGLRATFFNTGTAFDGNQTLARAVITAGHQIALHGMVHQPFLHERLRPFVCGLLELQRALSVATGAMPARFADVRPPFGIFTPHTLTALRQAGLRPVMWSSVPFHWHQTFDETLAQVRRDLRPGAIIVLHEGMPTGPNVAALADAVIRLVRDTGYRFVTVSEMSSASHNTIDTARWRVGLEEVIPGHRATQRTMTGR